MPLWYTHYHTVAKRDPPRESPLERHYVTLRGVVGCLIECGLAVHFFVVTREVLCFLGTLCSEISTC